MREKRQPVRVTAFAERGISALGEPHNRLVIRSDVRRLLGDRCPPGADDVDAVLRLDVPGRADAVARLGGPFARFIEFVTPEEASQQLGRVIVGAPALADEPYDLEAMFTLFRAGRSERHTFQVEGATAPCILDTPFAFEGQVRAMRWEAEVKIAWKGRTLVYTHHSEPLFPTIYVWRALVYNQQEKPIAPEQVMDDAGRVNDTLNWEAYVQTAARLKNVNDYHVVPFWRDYRQALRDGEPLAGYVATTVISPRECDVILHFQSTGPTEIYLNGQRFEETPVEQEEDVHPLFRRPRRTAVMHLRVGENTLVAHTRPSPLEQPPWFFGGGLRTPDGDLMTDLVFE
jgi:hypothetical protein